MSSCSPFSRPIFHLFGLVLLLAGLIACSGPTTYGRPTLPPQATAVSDSATSGDTSPQPGNPAEPASPSTPTLDPLIEPGFEQQSSTPIEPNGQMIDSDSGVSIQMPTEALDDGETAILEQSAIDSNWQQALEQQYSIDSPFVSLHTDGQSDSQGRTTLRLPAPSDNSQLVALIDGTYLATLNVQPQNGYLETAVRVGPGDTSSFAQVGSLTPGGSLHYVVLTLKANGTGMARGRWSKPASQITNFCGVELGLLQLVWCRQNDAGTVQVHFGGNTGLTNEQAEVIANAMATTMGRYEELGFTTARLSSFSPMQVVVHSGSGDPQYKPVNGVIYLPMDIAGSMSGTADHAMLHEIGHWIEDEEYNMTAAFWLSNNHVWWLETAAENMVMLNDPTYIPNNMRTYGLIATNDNRLALQQSPYQWPSDFYAHATLVKLNMCNDAAVCPLSETTFAAAISNGTYPFDSADAKAKLSANLDAYAQYLLGVTPSRGNSALPLTGPVATQDRYGEYIEIRQNNNTDYNLSFNGYAPQMAQASDEKGAGIDIQATLGKDGVYPLIVSSGVNGRNPGIATALTIQPGAPFWYRLDGAPPIFHDGKTELILQPIHMGMGHTSVRIAAMGKAGGELFSAKLRPIDLQGAWLVMPDVKSGGNVVCVNDEGTVDEDMDPESFPIFVAFGSAMGDFRPDAVGNGLTWEWNRARLSADIAEVAGTILQFNGAVLPGPSDIKMQAEFEWKRQSSQSLPQPNWPPLLLGLTAIIPAAWGLKQGRKRPYAGVIGFILAIFLLVGCGIGFDFYGTISGDMVFTQLEYVGGEGVPVLSSDDASEVPPLWRINGTGDYTVDFTVEVQVEDEEGNVETTFSRCTGTASYTVKGMIYKDMILDFE